MKDQYPEPSGVILQVVQGHPESEAAVLGEEPIPEVGVWFSRQDAFGPLVGGFTRHEGILFIGRSGGHFQARGGGGAHLGAGTNTCCLENFTLSRRCCRRDDGRVFQPGHHGACGTTYGLGDGPVGRPRRPQLHR